MNVVTPLKLNVKSNGHVLTEVLLISMKAKI